MTENITYDSSLRNTETREAAMDVVIHAMQEMILEIRSILFNFHFLEKMTENITYDSSLRNTETREAAMDVVIHAMQEMILEIRSILFNFHFLEKMSSHLSHWISKYLFS